MTDRRTDGERPRVDSSKGSPKIRQQEIAPDIAAKLRAQVEEATAMRRDLYRALQHQHCCCDECIESYRRWFR